MESLDRKIHWENIYQTKNFEDVGWFQAKPETSLEFLEKFNVPKDAKIIDCGSGESYFVDNLLDLGYQDITVLDISEKALEKVKKRLGSRANKIKWIVADISSFQPPEKYDFWHDRAAFHFLKEDEVTKYLQIIKENLNLGGHLVIGTFSENGPTKCSGIEIKQYSENTLSQVIEKYLKKIYCFTIDHITPSKSTQNFVFCGFQN